MARLKQWYKLYGHRSSEGGLRAKKSAEETIGTPIK